jgi:hypothetical protein
LNSSVYRARVAFVICISFADCQLRDTFRGGKIKPYAKILSHKPWNSRLHAMLAILTATAIQTVGRKGYDGFMIAIVKNPE